MENPTTSTLGETPSAELCLDSFSSRESTSNVAWLNAFRRRMARERVPISGILELTTSCNLKCVHCYLGPQEEQRKKRSQEMSTARVKEVIDEIAANGCLNLTITGGDPMVRKDFPEIYRHARERGLLVTVFCDGILVTDAIVELFQEYPPTKVDVSMYGASAQVYETVTRVPGSFPKFLRGLDRLHAGGVPYALKTVMMSINKDELPAMRAFAEARGVGFRVDSAIFPCLPNHDHEPLDLRVEPREAIELELSDPRQLERWVDYTDRHQPAASDKLYTCGAGVTNFYIDPLGYAAPCLMTTQYRHSLADKSFEALWNDELVQLRSKKPRDGYGCNSCEMQVACGGCPAFNQLENEAEDVKSDYVCETTRHRWASIQAAKQGSPEAEARRLARRRALRDQATPGAAHAALLPILPSATSTAQGGCGTGCSCSHGAPADTGS